MNAWLRLHGKRNYRLDYYRIVIHEYGISTGNIVISWKDLAMIWTFPARAMPTAYIDGFRGSGEIL
jgi:hypothetical protein